MQSRPDGSESRARSVDPCPVCGRHTLALEQPPHIPVIGAQPFTEIYRMGDLPMPIGVRCRHCGTGWPTIEALRAGEPGSSEEVPVVEGLEEPETEQPRDARRDRPVGSAIVVLGAMGAGVALLLMGILELVMIAVMGVVLTIRAAWRARPGR
jgi:hypothetical protein